MKVAVVGTGISGLTAAYLLGRQHEITLFEANDYVGGHTNTVKVPLDGDEWSVDTGFIVYNEHNYPNFTRLLSQLGVETQPSPSFHRILKDILRFNREAPRAVADTSSMPTLGDLLHTGNYSAQFIENYLVPMGSAIWSVPANRVLEMPTEFFVRFFDNHGMLTVNDRPEWRVIRGGSKSYVKKLIGAFEDRIRLNTPVRQISRHENRVRVDGEDFDNVVLACHSDQVLKHLEDPSPVEREILGALPYQENEVVLHTDTSILPRAKGAWAAWNYLMPEDPKDTVKLTYDMNVLQSLDAPQTFCVSLNATELIEPSKVLFSTRYHHPVYTLPGIEAQKRRHEISGTNRTHYCGAYWGNGFHEDGVNSALAVGKAFGATL
jgi:predicted NAD/FAD-binding protein